MSLQEVFAQVVEQTADTYTEIVPSTAEVR